MQIEALRILLKSHYNLLNRLEDILDSAPTRRRDFYCTENVIINAVNSEFKVDCQEPTRKQRVVFARHAACYLLKKYTSFNLKDIAFITGNKDHTTALHSYKACIQLMMTDADYNDKIQNIIKNIQQAKI
jgi:chromosomal replication initiation ATPase DnaA